MSKEAAAKDYMKSMYWTEPKEGQTESDIDVHYTLGQAKSLAENSFKAGWDSGNSFSKKGLIQYIYDFAWHYGRLYHIGDAEKIKEAIKEKFQLPEEFINQ